ncbi:biotin transporter BioY [Phenylobacterium sp.]|uniref:biotin transporter BioY n=1 Tax=Phenylobacterium sp. TaxID=1871053 RepID=UPI002C8D40CB|nr:biotin transporter BioY [Phenylobacterium sp.]HVI31255.1 biotin transporter BioY [Phenylobacterium sp.]
MTNAEDRAVTPPPLARFLAGRGQVWRVPVVLAGAGLMALASQAAFPVGPIPITLQSLMLFVLAGLCGMRLVFQVVLVWLLFAIVGLPVLAGGEGGPEAMMGGSAGFLLGMLLAAPLVARTAEQTFEPARLTGAFLLGHALILALGWAWLATLVGVGPAFADGVAPFLPGAVVKSLIAALLVWAIRRKVSAS